jgi:localization factor PodJL
MAARTSWNPRSESPHDYLDDDAMNPAYDDLLDAGFDEYGRLTRRRPARAYYDDPNPDDLRRAVDSLARQVDAATRQAGRGRVPPQDNRAQRARPLDALDRLEARLDAMSEEARRRGREQTDRPDLASQLEAHSESERARMEAQLERHFAALDQRIAALHDLARGKNVDIIRDDLATIGDRIEGIASSGHSVADSVDLVREQLSELRNRLESEGFNGANTLTALQDRLDLITDKLAQLELTPSALSAVERGYSHILERVSRIEQLAGQNVAADDLWDRLDGMREQIGALQSGEGLASLETRIARLADSIDTLSAKRGHDPAIDRVEMKLADMARTIAIIRDRRDMHSGAIEARLADITARIDKVGQDRGRLDFSPIESQIAALAGRIDQIGSREPELDVSGMENQIAELGGRIEEMLNRPAPEPSNSKALDAVEKRLSVLQERLDQVHAAAERPQPAAIQAEALSGLESRLGELHGRLDDITLSTGMSPADLTPIASRLDNIGERLDHVAESTASSLSVDLATLSDKITMVDEQLRVMAPGNPELPIVLERLGTIEERLERLAGAAPEVDLGPLAAQLSAIDRHLSERQPSGELDLQPLSAGLHGIESRLGDLLTVLPAETRSLGERLEAIDRRFDELTTATAPDLSPLNDQLVEIDRQLRGLTSAGSVAPLDWSPITERLDAMESRLADHQPGQAPDLGGLRETLAAIEDRLDGIVTGGTAAFAAGMSAPAADFSPLTERLQAIEERLSGLAVGSPDAGFDVSPLTERLQAIEQRLEGLQAPAAAGHDDDRLVPLLETFERALRKISTSDDIAALADKVSGLHSALDNAGEGSALDEMADLRNDITYLRRELRSMPMMTESEDGSGGLGSMLAEIRDRLDRIPEGGAVAGGSANDTGSIAAVAASIEASIAELKQANAAADDDTRRMLDAMNATMETIVGRMAYLEAGAAAVPLAEPVHEAPAEPQYDAVEPAQDVADQGEYAEIPEISIGGEPAEQTFESAAEEAAADLSQGYQEQVAEPAEHDQPEAAPIAEQAPEPEYDTPEYETAAVVDDMAEQAAYDTQEQAQPDYSEPDEVAEHQEQSPEPVYDTAAPEEMYAEPDAAGNGLDEDETADTAADVPAAFESAEPAEENEGQQDSSGSQSILGRLTSSQILKRATGGRADSFTPETDEQAEESSDTLLEPGTDTPMDSSLHDAPSSDTAVMSGEGAQSRTRQGAGLGDLAAASGLGLDGTEKTEEQGNQFLSAARRAARAAVLEASQVDPVAVNGSPAVRRKSRGSSVRVLVIGLVLVGLLAFAGYKYWRGELSFEGLSIGGFSLTSREQPDELSDLASVQADQSQAADGTDTLIMAEPSAAGESVMLEPVSPDSSIAFGAPETASQSLKLDGTIGDVIAKVRDNLPAMDNAEGAASGGENIAASTDHTASVPDAPAAGAAGTTAGKDLTTRTEELVAAALAGAKARTAALPQPGPAVSILPASIGSTGLRQAALANIPEAQFEIASRFADGSGVKADMATAAVWYEKAARKGVAPAQFRLGSLYEKGRGVPLDRARAARLYEAAAETGNAKAMHNLAVLYAEGATGEPDLVKAAEWFEKAADHGVRDSQFNIGILYARGLGVPENFIEAYKWFAIAAKSGDEQAAKRRDTIAASMSQEDLSRALAALNIYQPVPLKPEANLVLEPRGGWAAAVIDVSPSGPELVSRIQTLLSQRGFEPGPADGMMGSRTAGAIEAFQREVGLPVTGKPDLEVLSALQSGSI